MDKESKSAYNKAYYKANREKDPAKRERENKEEYIKRRAYHEKYYRNNKKQIQARQTIWRKENYKRYNANQRKYRRAHLEKDKARQKVWRDANRNLTKIYSKRRNRIRKIIRILNGDKYI